MILLKKDGNEKYIPNSYNQLMLIDDLKEKGIIDIVSYLVEKQKLHNSFGLTLGKNYFQELTKEANLSKEDVNSIAEEIERAKAIMRKVNN